MIPGEQIFPRVKSPGRKGRKLEKNMEKAYEWPLEVVRECASLDLSEDWIGEAGRWFYRQREFLLDTQQRIDDEGDDCARRDLEHLFRRLVQQFEAVRVLALQSGYALPEEMQTETTEDQWLVVLRGFALWGDVFLRRLSGETVH